MIRADPLLPLKPSSATDVIDDVDTPVLWPTWHCPFQNCAECGLVRYEKKAAKQNAMKNNILPETNSARDLWRHVWGENPDIGKHRMQLLRIVDKYFQNLSEESKHECAWRTAF